MNLRFLGSKPARLALTLVVLAILAYVVDWKELRDVFRQVDWHWLVPLYLLLAVSRLAEAFQLRLVIGSFNRATTLARVFLANALATFYGFFVPGELLATVPKWLVLSREPGSRSDILNSIVYNRIALLIPPIVIGSIALGIVNPFADRVPAWLLVLPGFVLIAGTLLIFRQQTGVPLLRLADRLATRFPARVSEKLTVFTASFRRFFDLRFSDHLMSYSLSTLSAIIRIAGFVFAAHVLLIVAPPHAFAFAYSLLVVLGLFPLTFGNVGVREGILISVLAIYGVTATQAVLLGMVIFGEYVLFAVIGAIYQISLSRELSATRIAALEAKARDIEVRDG